MEKTQKYETLIIRTWNEITKTHKTIDEFDKLVIEAGLKGWELKSSSVAVVYFQRIKI